MVTSRISYTMHYELRHLQDGLVGSLHEFSRLRMDDTPTDREVPVLYVAMATWIPKCNMYQNNADSNDFDSTAAIDMKTSLMEVKTHVENSEKRNSGEHKEIRQSKEASSDSDVEINNIKETNSKSSKSEDSSPKVTVKAPKLNITPKQTMSPKQVQKKIESEKKHEQKRLEREEKERKRQEEKEERTKAKKEKDELKLKEKMEKQEQKQKELEQKQKDKELKEEQKKKEKEEKDQKRKEKEERDEQKKKEREQEKLKRQQEIDEKNKEKQKIEEQKQKAAAAFTKFFVSKKNESLNEGRDKKMNDTELAFMPFQIKSDMRLAPIVRMELTDEQKHFLIEEVQSQNYASNYLQDIRERRHLIGKQGKTYPFTEADASDDVIIVEEVGLGESIDELKPKLEKMRAKLLKFHENRRPEYFGTWRKKSNFVYPRKPFAQDMDVFDYEVDSDEDWEEEEPGESLVGSDEEDKENDSENEYEVDNEFFVPHGHLSDDEVDDEEHYAVSPESHKAKLKLLKKEFDEEMMSKTQKIKPRLIGCIWYKKDEKNVDEAIDRFLQPFSIISNGQITIKRRSDLSLRSSFRKKGPQPGKRLNKELLPKFLMLIHGSMRKKKNLVNEFVNYLKNNNIDAEVSKASLTVQLKQVAQYVRCPDEGAMHKKYCWYVPEDVRKEYGVSLSLPNKWQDNSIDPP